MVELCEIFILIVSFLPVKTNKFLNVFYLQGLCSEVPMVAVREKYPGILSSENKIPIKTECVKVKRRHWKKVLKVRLISS